MVSVRMYVPAISATPSAIAIPVSSTRSLRCMKPRSTSVSISPRPSSGRAPARCSPPPRRARSARRASTSRRSANEAAWASCVTITTVWPKSSTASRSRPSTSPEAFESRLPDGSSANTTAGREISARATATRCCWPPDSSAGRWERRSRMPTVSTSVSNHSRSGLRPAIDERQQDVLFGVEHGQQVEGLEDEADPVAAQLGEVAGRRASVSSTPAMRRCPRSGGRGRRGCA